MPARNDERRFQSEGRGSRAEREVRRRRRSVDEKRQIAEASLQPGATVGEVAKAYGVHPSQVGRWRHAYRSGLLGSASRPALLAVCVSDTVEQDETSKRTKENGKRARIIHIEFARARVSIEGTVDAGLVRAVLECLAR